MDNATCTCTDAKIIYCVTFLLTFALVRYSWKTATAEGFTGPIHLDNVRCTGNESHILDCERNAIGDNNCAHDEDVYVVCISDTGMSLKYVRK